MNPDKAYEHMLGVVHRVRTPAGNDPRFASFSSIQNHLRDFQAAAHRGMKELHKEAIGHIMESQEALLGMKDVEEASELWHFQRFWYHVNNYLAWTGLKRERHVVRRLCGFKARPRLSQSNPGGVLRVLDEFNADPLKLAIWADATSFIDAGDILLIDPVAGGYQLLEVKQQEDGIWTFPSNVSAEEMRKFRAGIKATPNKVEAKVQRLKRQLDRMKKIEEVLERDTGTDPFLNLPVIVTESEIKEVHFHSELSELMKEGREAGKALGLVDGCLWVGVYYDTDPRLRGAFAGSAAAVFCQGESSGFMALVERALEETQLYGQRADHWLAQPVFSFEMPDEDVLDLISGIAKVRMFFHWEAWGRLLEEYGGSFRWLSMKEYRETAEFEHIEDPDRFPMGIPYVTFGDTSFVPPSTHVIRIFSDMLRPSVLAEIVHHMAQCASADR